MTEDLIEKAREGRLEAICTAIRAVTHQQCDDNTLMRVSKSLFMPRPRRDRLFGAA